MPLDPYEAWRDYRPLQARALNYLGYLRGKRLLLCGVGPECVLFAQAGALVWGFDISEKMVEAAQSLVDRVGLSDRIKVANMPFEGLTIADGFFDAAYGQEILHHVDLPAAAEELKRVLRHGGKASFIEPLGENPLLEFARRHLPYREKSRTEDESPMTYQQIDTFVKAFPHDERQEFSLLAMLRRRVVRNQRVIDCLEEVDRHILAHSPRFVRRMCSEIWIGVSR